MTLIISVLHHDSSTIIMNNEADKTYQMFKEDSGYLIERIASLAKLLSAASMCPDAQSELNMEAVGQVGEIIDDYVLRLNALLEEYQTRFASQSE